MSSDEQSSNGKPFVAPPPKMPGVKSVRRVVKDTVETTEATPKASPSPSPAPPAPLPTQAAINVRRWRVKAMARVSLFGQIMTLPVGKLLGEDSYSSDVIQRLRDQGVELEAVE